MLRFVADESHDRERNRVMAFAGMLTTAALWAEVGKAWNDVLRAPEFGVNVFHASACENAVRGSPFEGWAVERRAGLQRRLIDLLLKPEYRIVAYAVGFPLDHYAALRPALKEFMYFPHGGKSGALDDPWFAGLIGLISIVVLDPLPIIPPSGKVEFVFDRHTLGDRGKAVHDALEGADNYRRIAKGRVAFENKADVISLQAADLFAYESFRYWQDTGLDSKPERWQYTALRKLIRKDGWIPKEGLEQIVTGSKRDFDSAVSDPLPLHAPKLPNDHSRKRKRPP